MRDVLTEPISRPGHAFSSAVSPKFLPSECFLFLHHLLQQSASCRRCPGRPPRRPPRRPGPVRVHVHVPLTPPLPPLQPFLVLPPPPPLPPPAPSVPFLVVPRVLTVTVRTLRALRGLQIARLSYRHAPDGAKAVSLGECGAGPPGEAVGSDNNSSYGVLLVAHGTHSDRHDSRFLSGNILPHRCAPGPAAATPRRAGRRRRTSSAAVAAPRDRRESVDLVPGRFFVVSFASRRRPPSDEAIISCRRRRQQKDGYERYTKPHHGQFPRQVWWRTPNIIVRRPDSFVLGKGRDMRLRTMPRGSTFGI